MSDTISFNLAKAGYNVTKYVPYAPVNELLAYLIRRAEDNTAGFVEFRDRKAYKENK